MGKSRWDKKTLSKGQIIQRFESLHCTEIEKHSSTSAMWSAPPGTGKTFSVSYESCSGEHLQMMVDQIEQWVLEAKNHKN